MSSSAASSGFSGPMASSSDAELVAREAARFWWLWLVTGLAWIIASLVVLQFDSASITTIGVIVGCMFAFAGVQQIVIGMAAERLRWLWIVFGLLFLAASVVCFVNPEATFAGFADTLGFLFLCVGAWWTIEAFVGKNGNPLWWLGLTCGILMIVLAFWTSGQFFIEKAYVLLVFAGIWALMHGITDIARAFQVRSLREG
jgi:uncharacterized membrane protein HdeD (DUF308 family)